MLLNISTTHQPATDIGYLFHKHPDKFQTFEFPYGNIHVFYPEANNEKCTISLLLDINPIDLLRSKTRNKDFILQQYVNDRPYVASSLMSAAISKVFSSAMNGKCEGFPSLVTTEMPLTAEIAVLPARGGESLIHKIFSPLGYDVKTQGYILDEKFPEWGESDYYTVTLTKTTTLQQLMKHLYVLIPVLDNEKHYWVGEAEIDKLLLKGETWLAAHPEKDLITHRYLREQRGLTSEALEKLLGEEYVVESETLASSDTLHEVVSELKNAQVRTVVDLGCGTGKLLELLLNEKQFEKIVGADISHRALEITKKRLYFDDMAPRQRERIELIHSSLTYNDKNIYGFDAAVLTDVIQYIEPNRLDTFVRVLFEFAQPQIIIITIKNNASLTIKESMGYRFECTFKEFAEWSKKIGDKHGYAVRFKGIGQEHKKYGYSEQMGVFTLKWK